MMGTNSSMVVVEIKKMLGFWMYLNIECMGLLMSYIWDTKGKSQG